MHWTKYMTPMWIVYDFFLHVMIKHNIGEHENLLMKSELKPNNILHK